MKKKTPSECFVYYEYSALSVITLTMCILYEVHVRRLPMVGLELVACRSCRKVSPLLSSSSDLLEAAATVATIPHLPLQRIPLLLLLFSTFLVTDYPALGFAREPV